MESSWHRVNPTRSDTRDRTDGSKCRFPLSASYPYSRRPSPRFFAIEHVFAPLSTLGNERARSPSIRQREYLSSSDRSFGNVAKLIVRGGMTINAMEYREKDGGSKLATNPDPVREERNLRKFQIRQSARADSVASRILFKLE